MACSIRGKLDSSLVCNAVNTSVCLRVPVLWKGRFLRIVNDVSCCRLQTVTFRECDYSEVHCLSHIFSLNMCWQYWSLVVVEMVMTCCCCLGSLSLCCHTSRSCRQCHCLHHEHLHCRCVITLHDHVVSVIVYITSIFTVVVLSHFTIMSSVSLSTSRAVTLYCIFSHHTHLS